LSQHDNQKFTKLIIGAIGIVYGDIGTSPLYALKACFIANGLLISEGNIFGIVSLIFWSLSLVVSLKYISLILRADNNGEGGILALTTLCLNFNNATIRKLVLSLGLIGAAMFYGDGIITPAISILSALEGITIISKDSNQYIPYMAIILLIILFAVQKNGSSKIGMFFGPIMVLWFLIIGIIGLLQIIKTPEILYALNPVYGIKFLINHKLNGILTFGTIVLVLTGAEALYADIGHFNKKSIRYAWFFLIFPALILNYFGQGALLLHNPQAIDNPFYLLVPTWGLYPLIFLATIATIIASQSIISGIFSMSWQAIQLGYFPRMQVIHTSAQHIGQVYIPVINSLMLVLTIITVSIFQDSHKLASAYGIAVTCIMLITTILASLLAVNSWKWSYLKVITIFCPLIIIDLIFVIASLKKSLDGGWFAVTITICVYLIIRIWQNGCKALANQSVNVKSTIAEFIKPVVEQSQIRIPGTAIFINKTPGKVPNALVAHLNHNKFLHQKVIILSILTKNVPRIMPNEQIEFEIIDKDIYQITVYYGFVEVPNFYIILDKIKNLDLDVENLSEASFFLSKYIPISSKASYLRGWKEKLFIILSHNTVSTTEFFKIPHHRVIELGIRFKI
jgi:KUP system potassium uptake protein